MDEVAMDRELNSTHLPSMSRQDFEMPTLGNAVQQMVERIRTTPQPTVWRDSREADSAMMRLKPTLKTGHSIGRLDRDYELPVECHRELAGITPDEKTAIYESLTARAELFRSDRSFSNDTEWCAEFTRDWIRLTWFMEVKKRSARLREEVGNRYEDCTLQSFRLSDDESVKAKQQTVVSAIRHLIENMTTEIDRGVGLFMFGPVGSGKDHLLTATMMHAIHCGYRVKWCNGMDLYGSFRDAMTDDKSETDVLSPFVQSDVLALSDPIPPVGDVTPYQRSMLFRIIDRRYRDNLPTWITANVSSRAEADQRFGTQLVDRLTDGALRLHCNWTSYRENRRWTPTEPA